MDWRFSTFLLFLLAVLVGIPWATSDAGLCGLAIAKAATTSSDATTCFEFWLNRYQTLIGTLIALSAALLALLPARGQLHEMRRQSASSARQSSVELARDLESEVSIYKQLEVIVPRLNQLLSLYDEEDFQVIYQGWPEELRDLRGDFKLGYDKAFFFFDRYPVLGELFLARQTFKASALDLDQAIWEILDSFRRQTIGPDYEEGEEDITNAQAERIRRKIEASALLFEESRCVAVKEIAEAIEEAWKRARHFEERAIKY